MLINILSYKNDRGIRRTLGVNTVFVPLGVYNAVCFYVIGCSASKGPHRELLQYLFGY